MGMDLKLKSLITLKPWYTKGVVEVEVEVEADVKVLEWILPEIET